MLKVLTWIHVLGATSTLVVAMLALSRHTNPSFRLPLTLLAIDQFFWDACSLGKELTHDAAYGWLAAVVTPLFVPLLLHYTLAFTGGLARYRLLLIGTYAVFALEGLLVIVDWRTELLSLDRIGPHSLIAATTSIPVAVFGVWRLARHVQLVVNPAERLRSWLFVAALAVGVPLMVTDLLADMGVTSLSLATAGSCVFNGLLIVITLGVSTASPWQQLGQAVLLAIFVVIGFLTLFSTFREHQGVLVLSMSGFTLALMASARLAWASLTRQRETVARFATLGRFSAQMAHDLKNPLAAARGAAEILEGELQALEKEELRHFSHLLVQQLDRLTSIIDRYQRLSRMELEREPTDLNALVERVMSLQAFAATPNVVLQRQLAPGLPRVSLDPELISSALENLLKNAFEAMPSGGTVTVTTRLDEGTLSLSVRDSGTGMDPRTRAQVFGLLFTTKAQGSGLGLTFVQQIARAHGGEALIDSREGRGTVVELRVPVEGAREPT